MDTTGEGQGSQGPPFCYDYPRPAVTVDLAIFAMSQDGIRVLLIRRKQEPFAGLWALPGGFLNIEEAIEDGARRELKEETGFEATGPIAFLGTFGDPKRDPRGRTISMAHAAVIRGAPPEVAGGDDAAEAAWRLAKQGGPLAFDHEKMLERALAWLALGVRKENLGLDLLPEEFDEEMVRALFRSILGETSGTSTWLRRMEKAGSIQLQEGSSRLYHVVR